MWERERRSFVSLISNVMKWWNKRPTSFFPKLKRFGKKAWNEKERTHTPLFCPFVLFLLFVSFTSCFHSVPLVIEQNTKGKHGSLHSFLSLLGVVSFVFLFSLALFVMEARNKPMERRKDKEHNTRLGERDPCGCSVSILIQLNSRVPFYSLVI